MIQFLFRKSDHTRYEPKSTDHPREKKSSKQWTNRLADLVEESSVGIGATSENSDDQEKQIELRAASFYDTTLRLEGPYFTPVNPASYTTVICLVAGTGVSGAIAIAAAFSTQSSTKTAQSKEKSQGSTNRGATADATPTTDSSWSRCIVLWSVRESDYIKLPFFREDTGGLEIRPHLTGKGRDRLDACRTISEICSSELTGSTWVYISGPNPFIEAGEKACRSLGVAFYGARWT